MNPQSRFHFMGAAPTLCPHVYVSAQQVPSGDCMRRPDPQGQRLANVPKDHLPPG